MSELMRVGRLSYKGEIAINGEVKKPKRSVILKNKLKDTNNYIRKNELDYLGSFPLLGRDINKTVAAHNLTNHSEWYIRIKHRGWILVFPLNMNFRKNGVVVTPPRPSRGRKPMMLYFSTCMENNQRYLHIGNGTEFDDTINLGKKEIHTLHEIVAQVCMEYYKIAVWGIKKSYFEEMYGENTTHIERWVITNFMAGILYNWYISLEDTQDYIDNLLNYIECLYGDKAVLQVMNKYLVYDTNAAILRTKFQSADNKNNIVLKVKKFSLPTIYGQRELPDNFSWDTEDGKIVIKKVGLTTYINLHKSIVSEIKSRRFGSLQGEVLKEYAEKNNIRIE